MYHCDALSLRPQRVLSAVQKKATRGDPGSVVKTIDQFCRYTEWAMNMGDEKGTDVATGSLSLPGPDGMFLVSTSFLCVCVWQDASWTLWCQRSTPPPCWSWEPTAATPRCGLPGCFLLAPRSSLWNSTRSSLPSLAKSFHGQGWKKR